MDKYMTHEELVEDIERLRGVKPIDTILENICGDGYDAYERAYKIIKAIEPILEKQIPKKPYSYHVRFFGGDKMAYDCPSCKHCFTTMKHGESDYRNQFCDICGQAIDWSEA